VNQARGQRAFRKNQLWLFLFLFASAAASAAHLQHLLFSQENNIEVITPFWNKKAIVAPKTAFCPKQKFFKLGYGNKYNGGFGIAVN